MLSTAAKAANAGQRYLKWGSGAATSQAPHAQAPRANSSAVRDESRSRPASQIAAAPDNAIQGIANKGRPSRSASSQLVRFSCVSPRERAE